PREYVTGETAESALALLRRSNLPSQMEPCGDFDGAVRLAERLRLAPVADDDRGIGGNAARCAIELAVLDGSGRHFGEPLSAVTRLIAPEMHQSRTWVRYSGAITSSDGFKLKLIAWLYRLYGFRQIKIKVGIAGHDDKARLRAVRRRVGNRVELRVDANEAWLPLEAVECIRALEPFGIASVEQPVQHIVLAPFADARRFVSTPIMFDESLCSMSDAERAVEKDWCDLFNLRLSKCGGLIPTLRLAAFARRQRIGCQLGCQVGETAILSAAGRHFATSVGPLTAVEGSFDRHLVRTSLSREDITFRRGGWAPALTGPGLGITIDAAAVERVTVAKEALLG
ncbi:MAG TPA: enolase C-terminal domain-like protein, partial [Gemmataceae bacterium]|nr:enolase C-terminal domain-like protein [Gemmataceae bacterium]